jgi:N-acetylmuramoyl-L-alanine amidase
MREIRFIVVHCTAGPQDQKTTDIKAYWANKLGWKTYGYHYLIGADGTVENLVDISKPSNGVAGYNSNSIHVCYKGGWNGKDTRTAAQREALLRILRMLKSQFKYAKIRGHRDFSPDKNGDGIITSNEWVKLCPCFDAKSEYAAL